MHTLAEAVLSFTAISRANYLGIEIKKQRSDVGTENMRGRRDTCIF